MRLLNWQRQINPTSKVSGLVYLLPLLFTPLSCAGLTQQNIPMPSRADSIPAFATKVLPEMDLHPPRSLTDDYADPVPLPFPVNTAGAEDSAFIMPDGETLYFWFTPDPSLPAERQVGDGVTGIYVTHKVGEAWTDSSRIVLENPETLALDGCEFVLDKTMWFCTVREGFTGIQWFTAQWVDGLWKDWQPAAFAPELQVGELHITSNGEELYFHSSRPDGQGDYDIWVSTDIGGKWQTPVNVRAVNSPFADGWPFVSQDGTQLWFTRNKGAPSLWRSVREDGNWAAPEEMFSPFAGEASFDLHGNVYFTHHFYSGDRMLEADIYVAYPRPE
jgi:hypothetical protein